MSPQDDIDLAYIAPDVVGELDLDDRRRCLMDLVSRIVIPTLLQRKRQASIQARFPVLKLGIDNVSHLADAVLCNDPAVARDYILHLRERGMTDDQLFAELLEPAARYLGTMWDNDICDFIDVTIGTARLQALMTIAQMPDRTVFHGVPRSILLCPVPGNQHVLGIAMAERLFEASGWNTMRLIDPDESTIMHTVDHGQFDVIALSLAASSQVAALHDVLAALRRLSMSAPPRILLSGSLVRIAPEALKEQECDGIADNGASAVLIALRLCMERRMRLTATEN